MLARCVFGSQMAVDQSHEPVPRSAWPLARWLLLTGGRRAGGNRTETVTAGTVMADDKSWHAAPSKASRTPLAPPCAHVIPGSSWL